MEYDLFRNKVQQVKAKKPILFALETDTPPSIDKIEDFEKIYRMVLPETNCQGLFHQIHKKSTKKVPEAPYGS